MVTEQNVLSNNNVQGQKCKPKEDRYKLLDKITIVGLSFKINLGIFKVSNSSQILTYKVHMK